MRFKAFQGFFASFVLVVSSCVSFGVYAQKASLSGFRLRKMGQDFYHDNVTLKYYKINAAGQIPRLFEAFRGFLGMVAFGCCG